MKLLFKCICEVMGILFLSAAFPISLYNHLIGYTGWIGDIGIYLILVIGETLYLFGRLSRTS